MQAIWDELIPKLQYDRYVWQDTLAELAWLCWNRYNGNNNRPVFEEKYKLVNERLNKKNTRNNDILDQYDNDDDDKEQQTGNVSKDDQRDKNDKTGQPQAENDIVGRVLSLFDRNTTDKSKHSVNNVHSGSDNDDDVAITTDKSLNTKYRCRGCTKRNINNLDFDAEYGVIALLFFYVSQAGRGNMHIRINNLSDGLKNVFKDYQLYSRILYQSIVHNRGLHGDDNNIAKIDLKNPSRHYLRQNRFRIKFLMKLLPMLGYKTKQNMIQNKQSEEYLVYYLDKNKIPRTIRDIDALEQKAEIYVYCDEKFKKWIAGIRALNKYSLIYGKDALNGFEKKKNIVKLQFCQQMREQEDQGKAKISFVYVKLKGRKEANFTAIAQAPNDISEFRGYLCLACHEIVTIYEPAISYSILEYFEKLSLMLATTDSNNLENIKCRIVRYNKYNCNFSMDTLYYLLGFQTRNSLKYLICNNIQPKIYYFQCFETFEGYKNWFILKYDEFKRKHKHNHKHTNRISFGRFMTQLNNKTIINCKDDNFNTISSMKQYVEKNEYPNMNNQDKWYSRIKNYHKTIADIAYIMSIAWSDAIILAFYSRLHWLVILLWMTSIYTNQMFCFVYKVRTTWFYQNSNQRFDLKFIQKYWKTLLVSLIGAHILPFSYSSRISITDGLAWNSSKMRRYNVINNYKLDIATRKNELELHAFVGLIYSLPTLFICLLQLAYFYWYNDELQSQSQLQQFLVIDKLTFGLCFIIILSLIHMIMVFLYHYRTIAHVCGANIALIINSRIFLAHIVSFAFDWIFIVLTIMTLIRFSHNGINTNIASSTSTSATTIAATMESCASSIENNTMERDCEIEIKEEERKESNLFAFEFVFIWIYKLYFIYFLFYSVSLFVFKIGKSIIMNDFYFPLNNSSSNLMFQCLSFIYAIIWYFLMFIVFEFLQFFEGIQLLPKAEFFLFLNKLDNLIPQLSSLWTRNLRYLNCEYLLKYQSNFSVKFWQNCLKFITNCKSYPLYQINESQDQIIRICCLNYIILKYSNFKNDPKYSCVNKHIGGNFHNFDNHILTSPDPYLQNTCTDIFPSSELISNYHQLHLWRERNKKLAYKRKVDREKETKQHNDYCDINNSKIDNRFISDKLKEKIISRDERDIQFSNFIENSASNYGYKNIESLTMLYDNCNCSYFINVNMNINNNNNTKIFFDKLNSILSKFVGINIRIDKKYLLPSYYMLYQFFHSVTLREFDSKHAWSNIIYYTAWIDAFILVPIHIFLQIFLRTVILWIYLLCFGFCYYFIDDSESKSSNDNNSVFDKFYLYLLIICSILSIYLVWNVFPMMKIFYHLFYVCPTKNIGYIYVSFDYVEQHYKQIIDSRKRQEILKNLFGKDVSLIIELYIPKFDKYYYHTKEPNYSNKKKYGRWHQCISKHFQRNQISFEQFQIE